MILAQVYHGMEGNFLHVLVDKQKSLISPALFRRVVFPLSEWRRYSKVGLVLKKYDNYLIL